MKGLLHYRGARGELELLIGGTVEREAAASGERIYQLSDLDELLAEIKEGKAGRARSAGPAPDTVGTQDVGAMVIARALAAERDG
jgi:hypothetical protein